MLKMLDLFHRAHTQRLILTGIHAHVHMCIAHHTDTHTCVHMLFYIDRHEYKCESLSGSLSPHLIESNLSPKIKKEKLKRG